MNDYRILVVDDEEDLCEILKFNLETEGYLVDTANSAEEALRLDLTQYNVLLLDVMMGEISGFRMASMMKKNKDTANIPIIFITAKDTENDTLTGFNLGADDYISKPFSLREVLARVKAVIRRTASAQGKNDDQLIFKNSVFSSKETKVRWDNIQEINFYHPTWWSMAYAKVLLKGEKRPFMVYLDTVPPESFERFFQICRSRGVRAP